MRSSSSFKWPSAPLMNAVMLLHWALCVRVGRTDEDKWRVIPSPARFVKLALTSLFHWSNQRRCPKRYVTRNRQTAAAPCKEKIDRRATVWSKLSSKPTSKRFTVLRLQVVTSLSMASSPKRPSTQVIVRIAKSISPIHSLLIRQQRHDYCSWEFTNIV